MIVTEDHAKAMWCPQVRHEGDDGGTFNRGLLDPVNLQRVPCNCMGSSCMMWRWAQKPVDRMHAQQPVEGFEAISEEDALDFDMDRAFWLEPYERAQRRRHGYCGLAGSASYA